MDRSMQRKLVMGLGVVFALNAFALWLAYRNFNEREAASDAIVHTLRVQSTLRSALAKVIDAQTAARGYVITRDKSYVAPYEVARDGAKPVLEQLTSLVAQLPEHAPQMAEFRRMAEEQLALYQQVVDGMLAADRELLQKIINAGGGEPEMAKLRTLTETLQMEQDRVLKARQDISERIGLQQLGILLTLFVLNGAILTGVFFFVRHQFGARLFAEHMLSESEERFRAVTELAPHALYIHRDGRFAYVNPACIKVMGATSADELIGRPLLNFVHPEMRDLAVERIRKLGEGNVKLPPIQFRCVRLDGSEFWGESAAASYEQDGHPGAVVVLQDISDRKTAEMQIAALNVALEFRADELEMVNRELESFSYSVSHDLRAPLRSIDGFSQALLDDYQDRLDDTAKEYLQRVRAATQRMGLLIDGLLNMSRIARHSIRQQPVNLSAMAETILTDLAQYHPDRSVKWEVTPGMATTGDPELLRNVLQNLLQNAWKFTRQRPDAHIEFGKAGENGKTVFCVRDNGAGFDMEFSDKLFKPFQRLHRVDEYEGTGIGLATIQRIVRRHGGNIWAEGAEGQGASFYFTLPQ